MNGDIERAEAHYQQASELQPDIEGAKTGLGQCLLARGEHLQGLSQIAAADGVIEFLPDPSKLPMVRF